MLAFYSKKYRAKEILKVILIKVNGLAISELFMCFNSLLLTEKVMITIVELIHFENFWFKFEYVPVIKEFLNTILTSFGFWG